MYKKIFKKDQPVSPSSTQQMLTFFSENEIDSGEQALRELEKRERTIREIERKIIDINQLFVDVAELVKDQGSLVNNIELSIEGAKEETAKGVIELEKAKKTQASTLCYLM
ncbi:SNARE domain protein [Legionella santicrucis]|uniref:SNARE domain protein n=1 Tax=Legionella santicrucis TaxID=45074 RepID=A0A0W0ZK15_9GAMM|nr:hypothetical protein [Legionella santicrucis]KTD69724.1 SNARE domain protein [Legionella santicrucis]